MLTNIIEKLIENDEKIWLEYKSYWYWNEDDFNLNKGWGEFLKDFAALFNTYSVDSNIKYFIIGFNENTKLCQNYNIDENGKELTVFSDINEFKKKVIKKLKIFFKNTPLYKEADELNELDTLFDISIVNINSNNLLVFELRQAPYLLELTKEIQGNEAFKEGSIIIRKAKKDDSPENKNALHDEVIKLKNHVEKIQNNDFPHKNISIANIVNIFKNKFSPTGKIKNIDNEKNYSSRIQYEIFSVISEYSPTIYFVYFSKYTAQSKTLNYIKKNDFLKEYKSQIIVLTDQFNKDKGEIDKKRIAMQFKQYYPNVEVYYLEEFALKKLYNDLFDPEIFHQGNFLIKNFVQPFTNDSSEKTADIILNEWYIQNENPLLVIKGTGGIGKTTVLKYFLDDLHNKVKDIHILFISSHEIINEMMKESKIEDIFDFYKVAAEKNSITKQFDKKLLELSIDNGDLIIALDGLDEVISKMGSRFDVTSFIDSVYENYSENIKKTKILITCRDYFWDKNVTKYDINSILLKAFDKNLAQQFFVNQNISGQKLKKAMLLADKFALDNDEYIPYILDMISENLLDDMSYESVDSKILIPTSEVNDYLIGKVCEREIKKLETLSIDKQIEVFIFMATKYNGNLHQSNFDKLENILGREYTLSSIEKFQVHPLLVFESQSKILKFRYDFFTEYFQNIALARFLNNQFEKIDNDIIDIIIQHVNYDNSFTKNIQKRLLPKKIDDLKSSIWEFLSEEINNINVTDEKKIRLNSSLFTLLLVLTPNKTIRDKTVLLKELYEVEDGLIKNLCIMNLHTTSGDKPIFDFRGLKFDNCHFENYEYFTECKYDDKSYFKDSKFIAPLHQEGITPNLNLNNIDRVTCDTSGIIDILLDMKEKTEDNITTVRADIKKVVKFFWANSTFKQKLASEAHKKLKITHNVLEHLLKHKVVLTTKVSTKQKRSEEAYYINPNYSNLRKIMEENETCSEFEQIVKFFQE